VPYEILFKSVNFPKFFQMFYTTVFHFFMQKVVSFVDQYCSGNTDWSPCQNLNFFLIYKNEKKLVFLNIKSKTQNEIDNFNASAHIFKTLWN